MNPFKSKLYIKDISKELDINEEIIKNIIDFYWRELRIELGALNYKNIRIENLGSFKIKYWLIEKEIEKIKYNISNNIYIKDENEELKYISKLENILIKLKEEKEKFINIKIKRKNEEQNNSNLEK